MSLKLNKLVSTLLGRFKDASIRFKTTAETMIIELCVPGPRRLAVVEKNVDLFDVGTLTQQEVTIYWDGMLDDFIEDMETELHRPSLSEIPSRRRAS